MTPPGALRLIKLAHTLVWAFFVACIVGAPVAAHAGRIRIALVLLTAVAVESLVLALNRWTCPLTPIAARYTTAREPNFDIYLPRWLARYNKHIFAPLYLIAVIDTAVLWCRQTPTPWFPWQS